MRDGGLGHQKRLGDLWRLEPAEQAQGQRDLRRLPERRMTTGEDQPQAIVGHRTHRLFGSCFLQKGGLLVSIMPGRLPP